MRYLMYLVKKNWFLILVPVTIALSLGIISSDKKLAVFTPENRKEYTIVREPETEPLPDMSLFRSDRIRLEMDVPTLWDHVIKSGFDTFIDEQSVSSLQVQVLDYSPDINNENPQHLEETLNREGFTLIRYDPLSSSSYLLFYQGSTIDGIIDYFEYVIWDRDHIVKTVIILNDSNFERLRPIVDHIFGSIVWEIDDPIPEDLTLFYDEGSSFEFAYPSDWESAVTQDVVFYAMDPSGTGSQMTVTVDADDTDLGHLSEYDYSVSLGSGKGGFLLNSFRQNEASILAEASYLLPDSTKMREVQYCMSNGSTILVMTFDYPEEQDNMVYGLALSCVDQCRSYAQTDPDESEGQEKESLDDTAGNSENDFSLSDLFFLPETEISSATDIENPETENSASTFSEALMSILPMEKQQADRISGIWDSLSIGQAVYVEGVREDEESFVFAAQTDNAMNYCLTIRKDDYELVRISVGSEDGSVLYP